MAEKFVQKMVWGWVFVVVLGLVSCGGGGGSFPAPELPPSKADPQIFSKYQKDRGVVMADGWVRGMDMSGVAFDDSKTATLITRRHVVMAKHYARPVTSRVVFHDRNGKRLERKIVALASGYGDVMVGLLDEPVPTNYKSYPLPALGGNAKRLIDRPVIVSDQKRMLFVHQVADVGVGAIRFKHDREERHGWSKNLVVGDSGNPAFLIVGRELVLVETHTTGGAGAGPYYGDPLIQQGVREAVEKLDGSYQIRTVRVP